MTALRAAMVGLMHRYLCGLLDPFVTLLEVHKLMYFMQEAGEPLRLRFKQAHYGPYAENLGHVLRTVDGHRLSDYAEGGDALDEPLQLAPGAVDEAEAFLARHEATRARFDKVADLIEGFESPTGIEFLATTHWIMTREAPPTLDAVVARTHAWSPRNQRFTPRQIGIALNALARKGWTERLPAAGTA